MRALRAKLDDRDDHRKAIVETKSVELDRTIDGFREHAHTRGQSRSTRSRDAQASPGEL